MFGIGYGGPFGAPTIDGSYLYGTTRSDTVSQGGTIYKMATDGTDFSVLHAFAPDDGGIPASGLTLVGSTLYGTTEAGGPNSGKGTVFKVNTDGSDFTVLHTFTGSDGGDPKGYLTLVDSTLYGMTYGGGIGASVVYKIGLDGTGFEVLQYLPGNGTNAALAASGSTLYGMTLGDGIYGLGSVFEINTDGTGYNVLHSFAGGANDGSTPERSVIISGSTLYGETDYGGTANAGVMFALTIPEPSSFLLLGIGALALAAFGWRRKRCARSSKA